MDSGGYLWGDKDLFHIPQSPLTAASKKPTAMTSVSVDGILERAVSL